MSANLKVDPVQVQLHGRLYLALCLHEEDIGVSIYNSSTASTVTTSLELNPASFEEVDMGSYAGMDSQGSPIDGGSSSGGEADDMYKMGGVGALGHTLSMGNTNDITQNIGILGSKTASGMNNFVTKLYQWALCYIIPAYF